MDPETLSGVQAFAAVATILMSVAIGITGLRWVWLRTGKPARLDPDLSSQLQSALGRLEEQDHRIAELEERVDFSERLLAQQTEAPKLGGGER